ncbi:Endonuclease/exonuclease/phosphatase [Naematelia encephala]|uniref:Endonuclease/exonuclease/phosphatase n=1 Tax=Naematelia encephala TaxID=71784 RepID=A0A1Y2BH38_9TREE|nr:Endonuclease/exonuclease/phosphatase [Naematelia encephala]
MAPLNIFLTTWNTGLQGSKAQSQDLTSWLLPVLHDPELPAAIPDIYAVAVQELLPVHLALAGLSKTVLAVLTDRIQSLLSSHATSLSEDKTPESYILVGRVSHVGNALWIFARESTLGGRLGKPLTATLGLWWLGMGNKGAVGLRLPVRRGEKEGGWETLTFVCTHLEAYDQQIPRRNAQYQTILSSLIFRSSDPLAQPANIRDTSHLFLMGDLNYRLLRLPSTGLPSEGKAADDILALEKERAELIDLDTLRREQREGRVFGGLREGDLSRFAPTYKRIVGQIEGYSRKRIPGYTDRILFASHTDPDHLFSPQSTISPTPPPIPESTTQITHFSSTPSITVSDHKPVHAIIQLPGVSHSARAPHLAPTLASPPSPHPPVPEPTPLLELTLWKLLGTILDRTVGWPWCILVLLGYGNPTAGMGVSAFVAMVFGVWWSGVWSA